MNRRRLQLKPDQRSAKILRDRRHRALKKMEFERLRNAEMELQALVEELRNENTSLRRGNETLNDIFSNHQNTIRQLREQKEELRRKYLELQEIVKQGQSYFKFDEFPSPIEEAPNNETA
ncbi:hypothetical protein ERO13_D12G238500v2 [Gossypium hirsutum]|uniref:BZIP domain-containing protein n=2 Tax=Gossypium TaxID=3633 RepID=A0ABM3B8P9_GOSHI|nr:uncharacterized protein LOC121224344 [Gossypium hirsutum]KAG4117555.1 hypothetical protein ERO13_D12G238500v2 [Gossypium hirsutum]TYI52744.1 hypothetical protein E1A91_D12G269700v1 [Gossypium mustelinum]